MLIVEILFVTAGISLLGLAFWLGNRDDAEGAHTTPVPSTATINHALKLQNSLTELLHELQALSQEVTDDLEKKLGQLKELLQLADTKYEELSSATQGNGSGENGYREPAELFEAPVPALDLTIEDDDESPPMPSPRYQQIYQLADEGCSLDEIAQHVRMGKGEVQLILSLRKKD